MRCASGYLEKTDMPIIMFVYWCAFGVILTLKLTGEILLSWWWIVAMFTAPFLVLIFVVVLFLIVGWYFTKKFRTF